MIAGEQVVGGFTMPKAALEKLEELKRLYGEPPKDVETGYMKD